MWKGYIAFGLVNIPISLYSAVSEERMSFKLLHEKDRAGWTDRELELLKEKKDKIKVEDP